MTPADASPPSTAGESGWLQRHANTPILLVLAVAGGVAIGAVGGIRPSAGLPAIVAVGAGLSVLRRPVVGAYLLVGVVPIVSGLRRGLPLPNVRLGEAVVVGVWAAVFVSAERILSRRWQTLDWMLLAFAASWLALGLYDVKSLHQRLDLATLEVLAGPFQFVLLYRTVATVLVLPEQRRRAVAVLMWASVPVSLLALLQQLRVGAIQRFIANFTGGAVFNTYDYHYFARATGPFAHWTPLAGYLFVILLLGFALLLEERSVIPRRSLLAIVLLAGAALVLSAELSAIFGAVAGAVMLGARYRRLGQVGRWLGVGAVTIGAVFGTYLLSRLQIQFGHSAGQARAAVVPQTIQYRFDVWTSQYVPAIGQRLLTGWGPNRPSSITWQYSESQYLTVLMQGGLLLLGVYGGMVWSLFRRGVHVGRAADPVARSVGRALAACVLLLVPMSVVFPYLTSGGLAEPFWVLAGLATASLPRRVGGAGLAADPPGAYHADPGADLVPVPAGRLL